MAVAPRGLCLVGYLRHWQRDTFTRYVVIFFTIHLLARSVALQLESYSCAVVVANIVSGWWWP
jgi:hypothetical protein